MGPVNNGDIQKFYVPYPAPKSTCYVSFIVLILPDLKEYYRKVIGKGFYLYLFDFGALVSCSLFSVQYFVLWII